MFSTLRKVNLRNYFLRRFTNRSKNSPLQQQQRRQKDYEEHIYKHKKVQFYTTVNYTISGVTIMIGMSFAAVPLYKMLCEATGLEGTVKRIEEDENLGEKIAKMKRDTSREYSIRFISETASSLPWKFTPTQSRIKICAGETSLAFFKAKNLSEKPIIGIASYTVLPYEAAPYFMKVQCFCFEEQRLDPKEEIDMPVFFYLDNEINDDPFMEEVKEIILSYTFFESKAGKQLLLPQPGQKATKQHLTQ
ncbi:hypothetical protein SNEBB_011489 [Seison nebaliae]|nr:hypothetical protein SNEBB_011489 [Seison nebaliae]